MASLIDGYAYDIFISYRQNDNRTSWVTDFVSALQEELAATIKEPVTVYFDANPHDGLLETHSVNKSLEVKLKCLIFIPIISQTYCDTKSFAWEHEFCAFNRMAKADQFGRDIKLSNGNVASRILPLQIHELDQDDKTTIGNEIGGVVRAIDFIYKEAGVNRPLKVEDKKEDNLNKTAYGNQVNKVANAVKELLNSLKIRVDHPHQPVVNVSAPTRRTRPSKRVLLIVTALLFFSVIGYFTIAQIGYGEKKVIHQSIAVLPFENLSGDPNRQYLSDGIAEEIINSLAKLKNLKVAGRTSSFQFKGKQVDLREVGEILKVENILEGSVRTEGNMLRISVELISAKDGYQIWSEQFDRTMENVLSLQKEIALTITRKLEVTTLQKEKQILTTASTLNPKAFDAYLKGRYLWNNRALVESEKYFKAAIELDSDYAEAYAGLAETYVLFPYFNIGPPHEAGPKATLAAEKAIQLDSTLEIPYAVLAFCQSSFEWKPQQAVVNFKRAIRLNPRYAPAHYWYGQHLCNYEADPQQAIAEMQKALELEPLSSYVYMNLGIALTYAKRYRDGLTSLKTSIELNKQNQYAHLHAGLCHLGLGQLDSAKLSFESAALVSNDVAKAYLIHFLIAGDQQQKAVSAFADLEQRSKHTYVSPYSLSIGAWFLGNKDLSRKYFQEAINIQDQWLLYMRWYPGQDIIGPILSDKQNSELFKSKLARP